jgi:hypothetical protein
MRNHTLESAFLHPQHNLRRKNPKASWQEDPGPRQSDDEGRKRSKINKSMIGPVTPTNVSVIDSSKMGALANYSRDNPRGEQRAYS